MNRGVSTRGRLWDASAVTATHASAQCSRHLPLQAWLPQCLSDTGRAGRNTVDHADRDAATQIADGERIAVQSERSYALRRSSRVSDVRGCFPCSKHNRVRLRVRSYPRLTLALTFGTRVRSCTRSSPPLVPAAWARSIALVTRGSIATSRSRCCPTRSRRTPNDWPGSPARPRRWRR